MRCGCWNCDFVIAEADIDNLAMALYCILDEGMIVQEVHSSGICSKWRKNEENN